MKSTIQNINENPAFIEAQQIRERLSKSISEAQADAAAASSRLHAWSAPPDAVENALQIMDGNPALTQSHSLALEQSAAVSKVTIFQEALASQNEAIYRLTSRLSGELSQNLRGEHAEIVGRIADSLASLGAALQSEQAFRDRMDGAGYRCTLPTFQSFDLGLLNDKNSLISNLHRAAESYAVDTTDELSGELAKPAVIKLLADCHDVGKVGDIVELAGTHARQLIRLGRGEQTEEKLRRLVPKPSALVA